MINTTIFYKTENRLISEIKKRDYIKVVKNSSKLLKLFGKRKYADIYFHSGILDEDSIDKIKNAKFIITNSFSNLNLIVEKTEISKEKIDVIYPSIDLEYKKPKDIKEKYKERFDLTINTRLILFSAKNFKNSGIKEFLDICSNLSYVDFKLLILGNKQQLNALDFIMPKYKSLESKIIKLEESKESSDEIFLLSDIFLLPTHNKNIAISVIKAMFCKCVVFAPINNDIKEILDIYATMDSPSDPSTPFKIDGVLYDLNELKKIQKENRKIAKQMSLEQNIAKFDDILSKI
ncbi:MAG: glycosyltransferase [Aliarcobacter skirrowii]|nr:glycosyltransferase [Aliarcobacter skirrowii]